MIAADILTPAQATVGPDTPLADVVKLLLEKRVGTLPVIDAHTLVGTVSEADLLHRAELGTERRPPSWLALFLSDASKAAAFVRGHGTRAADVMTTPAPTVAEDTPLAEIAEMLERHGLAELPVLREGRLAGMVSRSSILRALASRLTPLPTRSADERELRAAVARALEASGWIDGVADATLVVEGDVVHLWGSVTSEAVHRALVLAAGEVPGVGAVRDHLDHAHRPDPLDRPNWPDPGVRVGG